MKPASNSLLLVTNGSLPSTPALKYGVWLAGLLKVPVDLFGVVESPGNQKDVEAVLQPIAKLLSEMEILASVRILHGNFRALLAKQETKEGQLVVLGPMARSYLKRIVRGRSFRRVMEDIKTPLLYVKKEILTLQRILVCMGGLGYAESALHWATYLAHQTGASIDILHVVEPISFEYPTSQEIQNNLEEILKTETPQGRNLGKAVERAQEAGIQTSFRVRRGDGVHEIIAEVKMGDYDLVVLGSPYSAHSLRRLYMPNVTAEIAESVDCPILTASYGQDPIFDYNQ